MSWYLMEAEGMDFGPYGLLVESFLDGDEHLFEALIWDDEVYLGSAVDRVTIEGNIVYLCVIAATIQLFFQAR